jgi:hypothetical protein
MDEASACSNGEKRCTVITLSHSKQPSGALAVRIFAAANVWTLVDLLIDVLDLFSRRVTFRS